MTFVGRSHRPLDQPHKSPIPNFFGFFPNSAGEGKVENAPASNASDFNSDRFAFSD
ncbi:MAG: hypothetical protein ABSG78_16010 [Verrucomicrobiota bacterium]